MRTTLYVLGAVLGAASGPPPALFAPGGTPSLETRPEDGGTSPPPRRPPDAPDAGHRTRSTEAQMHPCELITVVAVPCDPARATCEYTYWECPETARPLRV